MKTYLQLFIFVILAASCNKELDMIQEDNINGYNLKIDVNHTDFENTRSAYQWPDGAHLYIQFSNKEYSRQYPATAIYNSSSNSWSISAPQGELNAGDSTKCTVVYIPTEQPANVIELDSGNAIYEDTNAKYFLDENTLSIKANLSPKTARLRFAGDEGETIKLYGISHYITYNPHYNLFGSSEKEMELTVQEDGYTPYIHAYFPNNAKRLEVTNSDEKIFIFKCNDKHLEPGISGYFNIPTETDHGNWKMYESTRTFHIEGSDVSFKMIFVQWIEGSFYIAETEATQELWKAITNQNPSKFTSDLPGMPVENFSEAKLWEFIASLQENTSYPFALPTFAQWLHAAKGGNKTKGYKYSGSDILDEVAWYESNSNGTTHPVKSKMPNELGLYDMCGNVGDMCYDKDYYSPNYDRYSGWGGCFAWSDDVFFELAKIPYNSHSNYTGFRLCLNL